MTFILTDRHLELARGAGIAHARAEYSLGNEDTAEPVLDEEDCRRIVFTVTGQKLPLDGDDATFIIDAYESAYYETWEDQRD